MAVRRNRQDIFEFYRITSETVSMARVQLSGTWSSCVHYSESRMKRYATTNSIDNGADIRTERLVIDI